jgi:hypothetical protein
MKRKSNPQKRYKSTPKGLRTKSIRTKDKPSSRLVKRRERTMRAPKGFYANPSKRPSAYRVLCGNKVLAAFSSKALATEYAQAYADKTRKQCAVQKV